MTTKVNRPQSPMRLALQRLLENKIALLCIGVLVLFSIMAVAAAYLTPYDPYHASPEESLLPPSWSHPMGTDLIGRDILSRVLFGARISMVIGFVSVGISAIVGVTLGLIAGYYGRLIDSIIMRFIDTLMAFPGILLALTIIALLGPGILNVMIAVGIGGIPSYARLVRGSVLSIKEEVYVEAARTVGARDRRIILAHILPNAFPPVLVLMSMSYGWALLSAAGLSFLGLGAAPPAVEWGAMLNDSRALLWVAPWTAIFPGIAIMCVVLSTNLLGDVLRDAIDPRLRQ